MEATKIPSELYIEITSNTFHSASFVRPFVSSEVDKAVGFRSVYLYNKETYNKIVEQNAVRKLDRYPVYSDTLFVDFDDGDNSIDNLKSILSHSNIAWKMYFSGSKGYHFHIPIKPMYGRYVPFSQKQFIKGLGINTADTSIYKHTGLFRLPGTWHQVTGNKKELIEEQEGTILHIPYIEPQEQVAVATGEIGELLAALNRCYEYTTSEPGPGHRHNSLLSIAKHLVAAGASESTAYELCQLVHNSWEDQYENPEEKIKEVTERAISWQSYSD